MTLKKVELVDMNGGQFWASNCETLLHLACVQNPKENEIRWVLETMQLFIFVNNKWRPYYTWEEKQKK